MYLIKARRKNSCSSKQQRFNQQVGARSSFSPTLI